jgi:site-specific recombinase XerD
MPIPPSKWILKSGGLKKNLLVSRTFAPSKVDALLEAAKEHSRYPGRDYALILMMFRHGLRAVEAAELGIKIHAHMLRHSCGYWLANQGYDTRLIQDYLGHKNIQHTVRYTKLNPERFREIHWKLMETE